LNNKESAIMFI